MYVGDKNMDFKNRLTQLRNEHGLTQKSVAQHMNVSQSTYNHWESGLATPSLRDIMSLARLFVVTLDDLCGFVLESKDNRPDEYRKAISRLREMGIKVLTSNKTVTITVDGLDYVIDKDDVPELVDGANTYHQKMLDTIGRGMYQSAVTLALNSGEISVSQQYGKHLVNELEVDVEFWLEKHNEQLTPDALAEIVKDKLVNLPFRVREDIWRQLVEDLVVNNTINPDKYEENKVLWNCPSYRVRKK